MMNKKALQWAVAAAFGGMAAVGAQAATGVGSEVPAGSQLAGTTWAIPTTLFAPTTANPLYLSFTLTGGASFVSSPALVCNAVSGGGAGAINAGFIQLAAGGAGTAVATFVVTSVSAAAQISSCTATTNTSLIGTWPASVGANVTLTYGNALAPTGTNSTALYSAGSMFSNGAGVDTNTALVSSGFVSFGTATNTATMAYTARLGRFLIANNANTLATGSPANGSSVSAFVTALTITVAGPGLVGSPNASGQVFITHITASLTDDSAICAGTKVVSAFGGTSAISFSAITMPGGSAGGNQFGVCMTVTGGTAIPAGDITVGVTGTPNADPVHPTAGTTYQISTLLAAGTKIGTITRNGASTTVLNFPRAADADAGTLRINNMSSASGLVAATVYIQGSGTPLVTNCTLSSSLAGNSSLILSAASLEALLAACPGWVTPTTGRYRVDLYGAFSTMRAQALARTGGVLVNLSADTSTGNN